MTRGLPILCLLLLLCGLSPALGAGVQADAVAVYDIEAGAFLYRKKSNVRRAPASTIKVLSALTAWQICQDPDRPLTVTRNAANTQPTRAGLREGERFRFMDLLKAALIHSCNDAAVTLAENLAGTQREFAARMQKSAEALGCQDTLVTNASGLPDPPGMYTTCEDGIKMIIALRKVPELYELLSIRAFTITSLEGRRIALRSHNRMFEARLPYTVRGKTGYTRLARHCFLSTCDSRGRSLAVSIMGSPSRSDLWTDVKRVYASHLSSAKALPASPSIPDYMTRNQISLGQLQQALEKAGYPLAAQEDIYGPQTKSKVKEFQRDNQLSADGIAGPRTWRILKSHL